MKICRALSIFAILFLSIGFPRILPAKDAPKVLLFITDGSPELEFMLTKEVAVMKSVLEQSGAKVDIATLSGEPISVGSVKLDPVLKLANVRAEDYSGLIIPCMAVDKRNVPEMVAFVKKAVEAKKPVAAQFGGVEYLAQAGVLKGKKYAYGVEVDLKETPEFNGGIYSGTGVVRDGNIITSGICPMWSREKGVADGTSGLARALIEAIMANP